MFLLFQDEKYLIAFDIIDEVVLGVYATEILVKWYCGFLIFWRCFWNIFDLIIVIVMCTSNGTYIDIILKIRPFLVSSVKCIVQDPFRLRRPIL